MLALISLTSVHTHTHTQSSETKKLVNTSRIQIDFQSLYQIHSLFEFNAVTPEQRDAKKNAPRQPSAPEIPKKSGFLLTNRALDGSIL